MKKKIFLPLLFLTAVSAFGQQGAGGKLRSFDEMYPGFDPGKKTAVFGSPGIDRTVRGSEGLRLFPSSTGGLNIAGPLLAGSPSFLTESVMVLPYEENRAATELIQVYNALGRVHDLKGRVYHSATRDKNIPLFEEATRLESTRRTSDIRDPAPAAVVPAAETIYMRLKDANFGNSYYEAAIGSNRQGLLYTLSNFKNLSWGIIPVMKEHKFVAQLYIEPLTEGLLIYSASSVEVSDFIASKIEISSAIRKRLEVIVGWVIDGIKGAGAT